jgi:hypothetical protein
MLSRLSRHLAAAALVITCCVACAAGLRRDDVVGDYRLDYGYGIETLRLTADGQYLQLFRLRDADTWVSNTGPWEFRETKPPEIALQNPLRIDDGLGHLRPNYQEPVPGERILLVQRGAGALYLFLRDDPRLAFQKPS